ncbi:hypothetical protein DFH06DRAFT_1328242 [Mycena polygramma]|nr:hypothetical protein DFH06DRAFT_1328242 [Mycena polygramma]
MSSTARHISKYSIMAGTNLPVPLPQAVVEELESRRLARPPRHSAKPTSMRGPMPAVESPKSSRGVKTVSKDVQTVSKDVQTVSKDVQTVSKDVQKGKKRLLKRVKNNRTVLEDISNHGRPFGRIKALAWQGGETSKPGSKGGETNELRKVIKARWEALTARPAPAKLSSSSAEEDEDVFGPVARPVATLEDWVRLDTLTDVTAAASYLPEIATPPNLPMEDRVRLHTLRDVTAAAPYIPEPPTHSATTPTLF